MNHSESTNRFDRLLNVGCGSQFHPAWVNVDLVTNNPSVMAYDIRKGLPFADDSFDAVYHSHVLEHLRPDEGAQLIKECGRVLRHGGVMRIVVPDLERIAKLYLEMLEKAWMGDQQAALNYDWMKLELLDQMVRHRSGGRMGQYMRDPEIVNKQFVFSRIGNEYLSALNTESEEKRRGNKSPRSESWIQRIRRKLFLKSIRVLFGKSCHEAVVEGMFRQQGEVHRWMYDRYSLMQMVENSGFTDFCICMADESKIDSFSSYQLDMQGSQVRKPDSLFIECRKAAMRVRFAA